MWKFPGLQYVYFFIFCKNWSDFHLRSQQPSLQGLLSFPQPHYFIASISAYNVKVLNEYIYVMFNGFND